MLSLSSRCDQIYKNRRYDFGHTVVLLESVLDEQTGFRGGFVEQFDLPQQSVTKLIAITNINLVTRKMELSMSFCSTNRPQRWVCWTSKTDFKCDAEFHYAECRYAECRYAECHYAKCHYAECHYAECHYAECRYSEFLGAVLLVFSFSVTVTFVKLIK
jgi:hypothetical protein